MEQRTSETRSARTSRNRRGRSGCHRCQRGVLMPPTVNAFSETARRRRGSPRDCSRKSSTTPGVVPELSEETLQQSVQTFRDAFILRAETLRTYSQFHNTVAYLHEVMQNQLGALWSTALQLDTDFLLSMQQKLELRDTDVIPDDIVIKGGFLEQLEAYEALLDEIKDGMEMLRSASVRFVACVLSDDEKRSIGIDPEKMPREDVLKSVGSRPTSGRLSGREGSKSNVESSPVKMPARRKSSAKEEVAQCKETSDVAKTTSGGNTAPSYARRRSTQKAVEVEDKINRWKVYSNLRQSSAL
ncbi:unnamed protein product [Trypanosoma congolense IL3000]|uniref:WGS project CAEQ00000000 data, annotated contig 2157 n=1 Tax=Trypanosoma congolense (strain IL3000) TaxID=1068625 RepID=F9WBX5_TRYCI|nr:unnamed protein product [Trypanosoma congolense IL3000]